MLLFGCFGVAVVDDADAGVGVVVVNVAPLELK